MPEVEPAPAKTEAAPAVDLEAQLDSLLARISERTSAAETAAKAKVPAAGAPGEADTPDPIAHAVQGPDGGDASESSIAGPVHTESEDDLAGDALARQIQELLDDAKTGEGRKNVAPAAEPSRPSPSVESAKPAPIPAPSPSPVATDGKKAKVVAAVVQQLDAELAAGAEQAIAGDFEVPQPAAEATPAALLKPAPAVARPAPSDQPADKPAMPADAHEDDEPDAAAGHDDEHDEPAEAHGAIAGTHDDGHARLAPSVKAGAGAGAAGSRSANVPIGHTPGGQAVARELDEQPEKPRGRAKPPAPPADKKSPPRQAPSWRTRIAKLMLGMPTFKRCMALINQPLMHASAETRNIIGYVGLVTILNGATLVSLRVILGPPKPRVRPPAAQVEAASSESGEGEGHSSAAKKDAHADKKAGSEKKPAKAKSEGEE